MNPADQAMLNGLDAHAQADRVRTGDVSALELVDAAIARIDQLDPMLSAITWRAFDEARTRAAATRTDDPRPMAGVPWLLKDSLDYPAMPSVRGSRALIGAPLATNAWPFAHALDDAGLIPLGKTSVPEFALLPTTEAIIAAPARNPWSHAHSPGGSSGGSAVAVASGMVPFAHAGDGGGSIRIPASCCGLIGLKTGRGRNLRAREPHLMEDFIVSDTLLARSVRDVAWATRATLATHAPWRPHERRPLKIALVSEGWSGTLPHPDVATALNEAAAYCETLGHIIEPLRLPIDGLAVRHGFETLWCHLGREAHDSILAVHPDAQLEGWTRGLATRAQSLGPLDVERMLATTTMTSLVLDHFLTEWDIILSPVLSAPPALTGALGPEVPFDTLFQEMFDYIAYTPVANLTGLPALSLPISRNADNLPIGSMFTASRGSEEMLLSLASELEALIAWPTLAPSQLGPPARSA